MKIYIAILIYFYTIFCFSQNQNFQLDWKNVEIAHIDGKQIKTVAPENFTYSYIGDIGLMRVNLPFQINEEVDMRSIQFSDIVLEDFTPIHAIDKNAITSKIQFDYNYGKADGEIFNVLSILPYLKVGNEVNLIKSFTVNYAKSGIKNQLFRQQNATNSILANGIWYKIKVNNSGVYKLDKNFLAQVGIPNNVDPRTIKVYGHGGQMMPMRNEDNLYYDMPEVALFASGEADGVINDNDYFLFYGIGTTQWNAIQASHHNAYSDNAYYYITYGGAQGKRVTPYVEPQDNITLEINNATERVWHEVEKYNIANLSRKWFGETFNTSFTINYNLVLKNPDFSKPVKLSGNVAATSSASSQMNVSLNGANIASYNIGPKGDTFKGQEKYFEYIIPNPQTNNTITLTYNNNGVPSAKGYVDFVAIDYERNLVADNTQLIIQNNELASAEGFAKIVIQNTNNINQIWDVSSPYDASIITLNNNNSYSFHSIAGVPKKFIAVPNTDLYIPTYIGTVANQNLKGSIFADGSVDYLIITNSELKSAADKLANFHRTKNAYNVKVVLTDKIYQEFSSGQLDIVGIRNFIKYVYDNNPDTTKKLKFVNLFGDTSFDYKNITANNINIVPIFQSLNYSLIPDPITNLRSNLSDQTSFATDDFYGMMDSFEGNIFDQNYSGIDIAVGRMPADNLGEANDMVNKVIAYYDKENVGRWKLNGIALSDDLDTYADRSLQVTLNEMVDELTANRNIFNVKKILLDSYQQEVSAGGPRYPKAKQEFYQAIESGALFVNYLGHGGENGLSAERMMDNADIDNMTNFSRLPLFIIITCEFTRFDNPDFISGGEKLLKKSQGGAISLLATSRKIGITNAQEFTKRISRYLFNLNNISSNDISIAEALRRTKNTNPNEKGVVAYLGDPALKLGIPKPEIVLTKINGTNIDNFTGSIRALDLIKLEGEIRNESGNKINNFTGDLAIQLYDKNINRQTLGNDGVYENGQLLTIPFITLGETIFKGNANVQNGDFSLEFVVPKDIKLSVDKGKVSMYAMRNGEIIDDYAGSNVSIDVGGINNNAAEDNKPPQIKLYMNDESFIFGGTTNDSPLFLAIMEDENGMNTASGIGHDMVAILDNDENNPIVVNEYYETEPNNFRKGLIKYPFKNLKPGKHHILFKAWDVYNNFASAEIEFVVAENGGISLQNVLNYPNPFIDYTEFWFEHNRANEPLQVQVQIMSVAGRVVKTINQNVLGNSGQSREIKWDGRDDFGNKIGKGVYIYRLKVQSPSSGEVTEKIEKLVIL